MPPSWLDRYAFWKTLSSRCHGTKEISFGVVSLSLGFTSLESYTFTHRWLVSIAFSDGPISVGWEDRGQWSVPSSGSRQTGKPIQLVRVSFCFYMDRGRQHYLRSCKNSPSKASIKLFKGANMIRDPQMLLLMCAVVFYASHKILKVSSRKWTSLQGVHASDSSFSTITVPLRRCLELLHCPAQ